MPLYVIIIIVLLILSGSIATGKVLSTINNQFDLEKYRLEIGRLESQNNYKENSNPKAFGYYQFRASTLDYLMEKYSLPDWINRDEFLDNPKLQDKYFDYLVKDNYATIMQSNIERFLGQTISGRLRYPNLKAKLNWYGMQAGAHLGGVGGLKNYLLEIKDPDDGKTSVSDYCVYFSYKFTNIG